MREVALKLREVFPAKHRARIEARVTAEFIQRLVNDVTKGFGGDVGIVPRQFLRSFTSVLSLVDDNDDFDPVKDGFKSESLSPEEKRAAAGQPVSAELVKAKLDLWKSQGEMLTAAAKWNQADAKLRKAMGLLVRE